MNPRIKHLIQHPFEVQLSDVSLLQDEIDKYPYFSTLRILLLFGLKEFNHDSYQEELKKTSIHSPSRVALYHYLKKERKISTQTQEDEIILEETSDSIEENKVSNEKIVTFKEDQTTEIQTLDEDSTIEEKVAVKTNKELTFSEWLNLSTKEKQISAQPKTSEPDERDIKYKLIDEFIEKSPKIAPITSDNEIQPIKTNVESSTELSDLMTETLAQIYVEQKMYAKAIRAYKILSLKYPEKSEDFEVKIEEIKALQNN